MRVEVEVKEKKGRARAIPLIDLRDALKGDELRWVNDVKPKDQKAYRLAVYNGGKGGFNVTDVYQIITSNGYALVDSETQ
ncbi:MAG: hypothetical protein KJ718_00915 [Nanoarchaeota archaeon]|nr:hypothetical protein [Nanoarchaeota archaeon]MBU1051098.1 hypothetical protein [Nanoarchaeota archaeon]MBU1987954.1 hypothetical protein [Nanoarchaeota archaeon]